MTQSTAPSAPGSPLPPPKERRRLREAGSLTEAQLAAAVGVTKATLRSWETGRTSPRGRKREMYAKVLATYETAPAPAPADTTTAPAPAPEKARAHPRKRPPETDPAPDHPAPAPRGAPADTTTAPAADVPGADGADAPAAARAPKASAAGAAAPAPAPAPAHSPEAHTAHAPDLAATPDAAEPAAAADRTPRAPADGADGHASEPGADGAVGRPAPLTPEEAFDLLYTHAAAGLVRQTFVLTGRRRLSQEAVERAFQLAWQRWPEVATDRDPTGWVRAAAYEYAMSPWHRLRPAHRHPDEPPAEPERRELLTALHTLPPPYLRTLLLYDGLGLDLPETAAETEASTPAAASRVLHAREAVAERLPALAAEGALQDALRALAAGGPAPDPSPAQDVRTGCERRAEVWTRVVVVATALIVAATAIALLTSPGHYEPPMPPTRQVEGVPAPHSGPQRLTAEDRKLRDRLAAEPAAGPERLLPGLG
ncbi:helix-turn-helix domain-containing protein [Streptomyces zhihengii]|uniref:helix-turn-helix domain-containing protein n=1 Tax=Streptomyces zhihengii TaxID=1818004 RepID=UPI0036C8FAF7